MGKRKMISLPPNSNFKSGDMVLIEAIDEKNIKKSGKKLIEAAYE